MFLTRLQAMATFAFAALAVTAPSIAWSRNVSIDTRSGEYWTDTRVNLSNDGHVQGSLPFALNIGEGAKLYDFSFSENGFVQLLAAGGAGSGLFPPTGSFIAPFAADLAVRNTGGISGTLFGSGLFDPTPPYSGRLEDATQKEFRFQWLGMCPAGTLACTGPDFFEIVLTDRNGGDFLLEFNYGFRSGSNVVGDPTSLLGQQGFSLGSNVLAMHSGPFDSSNKFYCFTGGVGSSCDGTVSAIPEPETYTMVALGLAGLGAATRKRRSRGKESTGERR